MRFDSEILGLPAGTETLLRDLVHDRTGIFFDSAKVDLLMDKLVPIGSQAGFQFVPRLLLSPQIRRTALANGETS